MEKVTSTKGQHFRVTIHLQAIALSKCTTELARTVLNNEFKRVYRTQKRGGVKAWNSRSVNRIEEENWQRSQEVSQGGPPLCRR